MFGGRHSRDGTELPAEMLLTGKTELLCDLSHGKCTAAQEKLALFDLDLLDVFSRRHTEVRLEQPMHICHTDVC